MSGSKEKKLQTVVVQGLGFVGAAMAVAVANAVDVNGKPFFKVIGVDLPTNSGKERIKKINSGLFPFKTVDKKIKENTLIIVETTVPPGTCEKVVKPIIQEHLKERGINPYSVYIAHSYERVMPGANYLDSIINFWRVYAGTTVQAADYCENFLSKIINVKEYPLTRL